MVAVAAAAFLVVVVIVAVVILFLSLEIWPVTQKPRIVVISQLPN